MGSSNSLSAPFQQELSSYSIISQDPQNLITNLHDPHSERDVMVRKIVFNDHNQFTHSLQSHEKSLTRNTPTLQKLIKFQTEEEEDFCRRTVDIIYSMWEQHSHTLEDEFRERCASNNSFSQQQLHSLLMDAIQGLATLQREGFFHEKIRSDTISVLRGSRAQVQHPQSIPSLPNFTLASNSIQTDRIYLSPQQCEALELHANCVKTYKNDVWSLGMIVLEMGLLRDLNSCYKDDCRRIDLLKVEENICKFGQKYTRLEPLVRLMLKKNKKDRMDWMELSKMIQEEDGDDEEIDNRKSPEVINYLTLKPSVAKMSARANPNQLYAPLQPHHVNIQQHQYPPFIQSSLQPQRLNFNWVAHPAPPQFTQYLPIQAHQHPISTSWAPITSSIVPPPNMGYNEPQRAAQLKSCKQSQGNQKMKRSAGYHKILNEAVIEKQVSRFVSPASRQGFLFTHDHQAKNQNQEYKPLNIQILKASDDVGKQLNDIKAIANPNQKAPEQEYRIETREKKEEVQLMQKGDPMANTYIKNAESITYESDRGHIPLALERKESKGKLGNKQGFWDTKQQNLVSHEDEDPEREPLEYVIETFSQGSRYEGTKLGNMRHGQGKFYYQDGGLYDGQWVRNRMQGRGKLFYQNGNLAYEGEWMQDQFEGRGKLYNNEPEPMEGCFDCNDFEELKQQWEYYEGQFHEDLKEGRGKLMLTNGEYFAGCFHDDMIEGPGKFHGKKGVVKGQWRRNVLVETSAL